MSRDFKRSREDKNAERAASSSPALLTRAEVAALLHCSISSVRRLEGDALHSIVGADSVHRFDPAEVARVASHRSVRPVEGSKEGERDARVFEAFAEGKGLREIVTALRLPADLVNKLHASWQKMGSNQDMILSAERLAQLRSALGMDVKRPADLVEEVRWLAEQCTALEAERNQLDSQLGELMSAMCKPAVHDPNMAKSVSELNNTLDSDLRRRLDTALKYFMNEHASVPTVPPAAVLHGEPHPQSP